MSIVTSDCGTYMRLIVDGRVDTVTSPQLQQAILLAFQQRNDVVVDFFKRLHHFQRGSARPFDRAEDRRVEGRDDEAGECE